MTQQKERLDKLDAKMAKLESQMHSPKPEIATIIEQFKDLSGGINLIVYSFKP